MSKVKQPLESAMEYAMSQSGGPEGPAGGEEERGVDVAAARASTAGLHAFSSMTTMMGSRNNNNNNIVDTTTATTNVPPPIVVNAPTPGEYTLQQEQSVTTTSGAVTPPSNVPKLSLHAGGASSKSSSAGGIILDTNGNPLAYDVGTEQQTLNLGLYTAVLDVESNAVEITNQFNANVLPDIRARLDALQPVRTATYNEFMQIYAIHELPPVSAAQFVTDRHLKSNVEEVALRAKELEQAESWYRTAPGFLDELKKPVALLRRRAEIQAGLEPVSQLLLRDAELTKQLIIEMHEIAQCEVFSFTNTLLAEKQRELDALRASLKSTSVARNDALASGDVRGAERLSFQELQTSEEIIARIVKRVEIIFQCDSDVKAFVEKYEAARERGENALIKHNQAIKEWIAELSNDIDVLKQAMIANQEEDERREEAYDRQMEVHKKETEVVSAQERQNWEEIVRLVEKQRVLAEQRKAAIASYLNCHAKEVSRRAEVDAWVTGCENLRDGLSSALNSAKRSVEWIGQLQDYMKELGTQIEAKNIDEQAFNMRVGEQFDHLDAYKYFKTLADDIGHRKEMRITSLNRVVRNFQLQIKEAIETLDPNTKKYEAEVLVAQEEIKTAEEKLMELRARSKAQSDTWKKTEENLESSMVKFTPPDIAAEMDLCQKKTDAISVARQFVNVEQETVDLDMMRLRKLKTSNLVAIEGFQKRRAERQQLLEGSPAASLTAAPHHHSPQSHHH